MGFKDRVTLYVAAHASGRKVPLAMIGHSKNPRCFRLRKMPVKYFSQSNAWSDARVFGLWWEEVLLPWVRSITSKPVLLIMDNHSSHANLVDPRGQVTVLELPPNCTAKHQPCDAGIIAALKKIFRTLLLRIRVDTMDDAANLRTEAIRRKVVSGCHGLAEGSAPHLLDAAELCNDAWGRVSEDTIRRCVDSLFFFQLSSLFIFDMEFLLLVLDLFFFFLLVATVEITLGSKFHMEHLLI